MNKYNPNIHHRRSIRLKGYDYSQAGLYFITVVCQNRECLFGRIADGKMALNDAGKMVENQWLALKSRFPIINLHEYMVMPNHFHGILEIVGATLVVAPLVVAQNDGLSESGQPQGIAPTTKKTIGDMMDAFKSITTVEYIRGVKNWGWPPFNGKLWQRNYWEHIIRNEQSYHRISAYIINNPAQWNGDKFQS
jgi:putative transposase